MRKGNRRSPSSATRTDSTRVRPWDKLLTVLEVAELLGCHFRTVHRLIHHKELRAIQVGREFRITRQDYEAYLQTHGTKPASGTK